MIKLKIFRVSKGHYVVYAPKLDLYLWPEGDLQVLSYIYYSWAEAVEDLEEFLHLQDERTDESPMVESWPELEDVTPMIY